VKRYRDGGSESGLSVIDVANGPDVHVRLQDPSIQVSIHLRARAVERVLAGVLSAQMACMCVWHACAYGSCVAFYEP
jgi:hypothetical protein